MKASILESDWKQVCPRADNVLVIKDEDESVSRGGIVIPDAAQSYKRRGWVLAVGGGFRASNGDIILPPYKPGDYLVADRAFLRRDETEDELFGDPTIILVRGDEPSCFIRREDCVGKYARYALPARHEKLVEKFGFKPAI